MKQYVIDELRPADFEKIKAHLDENFDSSTIQGIFWISLDKEILKEHSKGLIASVPVMGIDVDIVRAAVAAFAGVPGRMERIDLGQQFLAT